MAASTHPARVSGVFGARGSARAGDPVPADADDAPRADEPRLDLTNIQGNIWPGFNKDHQMLLFLRIVHPGRCKAWLKWLTPMITNADVVRAFRGELKAVQEQDGKGPDLPKATWVNIGFSFDALRRLTEGV